MIEINRKVYRNIINMNRQQLQKYLNDLYNEGFNNGVKAISKQVAEKVDRGVRNTAGVGEKRYADIMASINREFQGGREGEQ